MNQDIKTLLVKYISGQADETESAVAREWIKSDRENEACYFEVYESWHAALYARKDVIDVDSAYQDFLEKVRTGKPFYRRIDFWKRLSAVALVVLVCSVSVYRYLQHSPAESLVALEVPKGGTKKVVLRDGSIVWINAGSQISYAKDFGKKNRIVYLSGEAYFDIAEGDKDIPFLVKTDTYTIRDVGTVFNVKAYPGEAIFETTVVEGKVSVEGKLTEGSDLEGKVFLEANQVLKINQRVQLDDKSPENREALKVIRIDAAKMAEYNGWKDDLLVFDGASLEDIATTLERRYNVDVEFLNKEFAHYKYTGVFKNIQDVTKVFEVIKQTTPIDYTVTEHRVTIKKQPINVN